MNIYIFERVLESGTTNLTVLSNAPEDFVSKAIHDIYATRFNFDLPSLEKIFKDNNYTFEIYPVKKYVLWW